MTLLHLNNEVAAAQKRRAVVSAEVEAQTQVLLTQREVALKEVEDRGKVRLKELAQALSETKAAVEAAQVQKRSLTADVEQLGQEKSDQLTEVANLTAKVGDLNRSIESKERQELALEEKVRSLQARVDPLLTQRTELEEQLVGLRSSRQQVEQKAVQLEESYQSRKTEVELDIGNLLEKHEKLSIAQVNMHKQYAQMGEDIAIRTKALDERDEVLKRREFKVSQDEARVAQNANLLQL